MPLDKIDKTTTPFVDIPDDDSYENAPTDVLIKQIVDKINEIVDWINSQ